MLFFRNDYGQGCIPEIMEYMNTTNGHFLLDMVWMKFANVQRKL